MLFRLTRDRRHVALPLLDHRSTQTTGGWGTATPGSAPTESPRGRSAFGGTGVIADADGAALVAECSARDEYRADDEDQGDAPGGVISTAILNGSEFVPTADRACTPFAPNTSPRRLEAPLITCGCCMKFPWQLTQPSSFTNRLTLSRSPNCCFNVESMVIATSRDASAPWSTVKSLPTYMWHIDHGFAFLCCVCLQLPTFPVTKDPSGRSGGCPAGDANYQLIVHVTGSVLTQV